MPGADEELRELERKALEGDKAALERLKGLYSGRYRTADPPEEPKEDVHDKLARDMVAGLLDGPGSIPSVLSGRDGLAGTVARAVLASGVIALMRPALQKALGSALRNEGPRSRRPLRNRKAVKSVKRVAKNPGKGNGKTKGKRR